jgi:hypothetical protein
VFLVHEGYKEEVIKEDSLNNELSYSSARIQIDIDIIINSSRLLQTGLLFYSLDDKSLMELIALDRTTGHKVVE